MENRQALESQHMYTVGWISALPLELAVASAMLDAEHNEPLDFAPSPSDKNIYTFGRIAEHNVVLASLPAGIYGTTSADTTVSQMLSSFPNIRVGLMVGIGAGIPSQEVADIRLGDVVVSQPDGRCGGVIQYDLRKAKSGETFERKGILSPPPETLLKALAKLQALHERQDSRMPQFLHHMLERNPHMRKSRPSKPAYVYQGRENDRLFKADYVHSGGITCTTCDSIGEMEREERESTDPEIHYGIIASGNTLIKDAIFRDKIIQDTGEQCICLEMEASGIINTFPCLVIRGICDYADSHKNDRWQRYAAATAAAYTKELLGVVPHDDLKRTRKASEVLQEGR